jgi:RHS repeat-associated protein
MGSACSLTEVRQDYSYSPLTGRLSSEDTRLWQGASQLESWTQSYVYDGAGQITGVTYPSCTWLCSSPSRTVTTAYTFGKTTSVSGFASITYNDNGTLATIAHGDNVVFTETADPNGMARPGSLRADGPNQSTPWPKETYSFDSAGNIKAIGSKTYAYDGDSRIVSAIVPSSVAQPYQGFTYDAYGNLTSVASGANPGSATTVYYPPTTCDTPAHCTNRLSGASYDDSGELTAYQGSTYAWDALGQVTSLYNGSEVWTHLYDANGQRVWSYRTSPSRLDTYALRGQDGRILSVYTKTGSTYTWEDYAYREGQVLGAAFSSGHLVHFDVDHLGSVRLETDGNGTTYRDFWPYGSEATPPGGTERMKFAGQERDLGNLTGTADDIDYMHARYYRPLFGRFLSPDPHAGSAAAPKSWNLYSYAAGNPLRFTDPTGMYLCSDKSACTDFENARVADLNDPATRAAAEAFGKPDEPNGITVGIWRAGR